MDRLNLYPEMNKEIVNIFRLSDDNPMNLYAAQLIETQAAEIEALKAENARLSRESDALLEDLKKGECCDTCKHENIYACEEPCVFCYDCSHWKWRGADKGV